MKGQALFFDISSCSRHVRIKLMNRVRQATPFPLEFTHGIKAFLPSHTRENSLPILPNGLDEG